MLPILALLAVSQVPDNRTALALERCLATPEKPQSDGQSDTPQVDDNGDPIESAAPTDDRATCYDNATRSYDQRILQTYRTLLKRTDPDTAQKLVAANQAWLNYRETATPGAGVAAVARDHALWLEGLLRGR